ncbi:uncharacterized protein C8Q71DRAFT_265290 [Rhodofomes roseus]|uniref:Uncharacterized protein n=1 Tax=Rhodofomes roseus TaxID=34475 RepID=A0ABQ8K6M9_9APHY|nr:uncharacterized protein C8Q71DRAFT_265290 [Rhodofomes roseus]KAH9832188.1 hypothetical protein C8Q71DRAFT_265290 [Rhodofomes roseus]
MWSLSKHVIGVTLCVSQQSTVAFHGSSTCFCGGLHLTHRSSCHRQLYWPHSRVASSRTHSETSVQYASDQVTQVSNQSSTLRGDAYGNLDDPCKFIDYRSSTSH